MHTRVQQALDGELSVEELSPSEAARLEVMRRTLDRVIASLPDPAVETWPAVRQQIAERIPVTRKRRLLAWLFEPRQLSLRWRPAYGLAAAVLLVAALTVPRLLRTENPAVPAGAQQVLVQFRLEAPGAERVMLAGDFTEWKPVHSLRRSGNGVWTVVVPLDPGIHDYGFVVDGQRWVPDPLAPAVSDGFGGMNSRLAILTPDVR